MKNKQFFVLLIATVTILILASVQPVTAEPPIDCTAKWGNITGDKALFIWTDKDSVPRGQNFNISLEGKPSTDYYLWVSGTGAMSGNDYDRPPVILDNQPGVTMDPDGGPYNIGSYVFYDGGGKTVQNDIPPPVPDAPNTHYYALVHTKESGYLTITFQTSLTTRPGEYIISAENCAKTDKVAIRVEKIGATIRSEGDQSYELNETIRFHGENKETKTVYLFLIGPYLSQTGVKLSQPATAVVNGNNMSFDSVTVSDSNSWSYSWKPQELNLVPGTYTIYAVSYPFDKNHLQYAGYGTVSIILHGPDTPTPTSTALLTSPSTTIPTTLVTTPATPTVTTVSLITTPIPAATAAEPRKTPVKILPTPWPSTTPATTPESPLPAGIAGISLVIGAGAILWKRG